MNDLRLKSTAAPVMAPANQGLAAIFFMIGAPHVYAAMRSRAKQRQSSQTNRSSDPLFTVGFLAMFVVGLVSVLTH